MSEFVAALLGLCCRGLAIVALLLVVRFLLVAFSPKRIKTTMNNKNQTDELEELKQK